MKVWIIIVMMAVVTYLPRYIPLQFLRDRELSPFIRRILSQLPYAALGALIFPGVIHAVPGFPLAAIAGMATAVAVSWFKGGLVPAVLTSIAISFLVVILSV